MSEEKDLKENVTEVTDIVENTISADLKDSVTETAQDVVDEIYEVSEDKDKPDFDVELMDKRIESASYLELPLFKRKLERMKNNLDEVKSYMDMLPLLKKYMEETVDTEKPSELEVYNELQNRGVNMELQLKSVTDKYEINISYINKWLERIEERINSEKDAIVNSPTSVKSKMMEDMIIKNNSEVDDEKPSAERLHAYFNTMLEVYHDRLSLEWVYNKLQTGTNPRSIYTLYKRAMKSGETIESIITKTFNFTTPVYFKIGGLDKDTTDFFYFFICHICRISDLKNFDIRARKNKEYGIIMIQNLGDIENGLFDIANPDDYVSDIMILAQTIWSYIKK